MGVSVSNLKWTLLLLISSIELLGGVSPLYPEDGSMGMNKWYVSPDALMIKDHEFKRIENAFNKEGVEVVDFNFPYEYTQDISLFDQDGKFVHNYTALDDEYLGGLTMGVAREHGRYIDLLVVGHGHLKKQAIPSGRTIALMLEGGGVITGQNAEGEDYLILRGDRFSSSVRHYREVLFPGSTEEEAKAYFAESLGIKAKNLIPLKRVMGAHLDTYMKALPGGVILLNDPSKALGVLKELYKKSRSRTERKFIKLRIEAHERFNSGYKHKNLTKNYDKVEKILSRHLKVVRVAGIFYQTDWVRSWDGSKGNVYEREEVNFFNAVSAVKEDGSQFYIGNEAKDTPSLEAYWADTLVPYGFPKSQIHFPGIYNPGNGIDCFGTPSL